MASPLWSRRFGLLKWQCENTEVVRSLLHAHPPRVAQMEPAARSAVLTLFAAVRQIVFWLAGATALLGLAVFIRP